MGGYIVKIAIEYTQPPVWRRLIIPKQIRFDDLHRIIQIAFSWEDIHLHEFSFPNDRVRIRSSEQDFYGATAEETEILLDDYVKSYNFIRYTYDFGDNWSHKIIFEQEDSTYQNRFATIIKARGYGFMEDSRGMFYEDEEDEEGDGGRIPFSIEQTNVELEQLHIPKRKGTHRKTQKESKEEWSKEIKKMFSQLEKNAKDSFGKMLNEVDEEGRSMIDQVVQKVLAEEKSKGTTQDSKMKIKIRTWLSFLEEASINELMESEKRKEKKSDNIIPFKPKHEQIAMSFFDQPKNNLIEKPLVKEEIQDQEEVASYKVYKIEGTKTLRDNLEKLSKKGAKDYCKYLNLPHSHSASKKEMLNKVATLLRYKPEYFLWVLEEEEWRSLNELIRRKGELTLKELNSEAIVKAISMGLLDYTLKLQGQSQRVDISFVEEIKSIQVTLTAKKSRQVFEKLKTMDQKIGPILLLYGFMDLDTLFVKYENYTNKSQDRVEFNRYIYWHGNFTRLVLTLYSQKDKKNYVALPRIDVNKAFEIHSKYMSDMAYKEFDSKLINKFGGEINRIYPFWEDYDEYLFYALSASDEERELRIMEDFNFVMKGATSSEMVYDLLKMHRPRTMAQYLEFWFVTLNVVMSTGLFYLKGYSRNEYIQIKKNSLTSFLRLSMMSTPSMKLKGQPIFMRCHRKFSLLFMTRILWMWLQGEKN